MDLELLAAELAAMQAIIEALKPLDPDARTRVLRWLQAAIPLEPAQEGVNASPEIFPRAMRSKASRLLGEKIAELSKGPVPLPEGERR